MPVPRAQPSEPAGAAPTAALNQPCTPTWCPQPASPRWPAKPAWPDDCCTSSCALLLHCCPDRAQIKTPLQTLQLLSCVGLYLAFVTGPTTALLPDQERPKDMITLRPPATHALPRMLPDTRHTTQWSGKRAGCSYDDTARAPTECQWGTLRSGCLLSCLMQRGGSSQAPSGTGAPSQYKIRVEASGGQRRNMVPAACHQGGPPGTGTHHSHQAVRLLAARRSATQPRRAPGPTNVMPCRCLIRSSQPVPSARPRASSQHQPRPATLAPLLPMPRQPVQCSCPEPAGSSKLMPQRMCGGTRLSSAPLLHLRHSSADGPRPGMRH